MPVKTRATSGSFSAVTQAQSVNASTSDTIARARFPVWKNRRIRS
jgi:hypothetical protein